MRDEVLTEAWAPGERPETAALLEREWLVTNGSSPTDWAGMLPARSRARPRAATTAFSSRHFPLRSAAS